MGFKLGKVFKNAGHSVGNLFKSGGKTITGAISDVYNDTKHATGGVYKDIKGATKYAGKHLINDVDNISSALSSPLLYIGVGVVVIMFLSRR